MQPYRPLYSVDEPRREPPAGSEDRALAFLLIVLGTLRVIPAVVRGELFGAEATIALIMLVLGLVIVARGLRRRRPKRRAPLAAVRARPRPRRRW